MAPRKFKIDIESKLAKPETAFISNAAQEETTETQGNSIIPAGYRLVRETKSKKTQVAFQPSLFAAVKAEAEKEGESFNEMLHVLLREALENRK